MQSVERLTLECTVGKLRGEAGVRHEEDSQCHSSDDHSHQLIEDTQTGDNTHDTDTH